jgi:hypothetical protein
MLQHSEGDHLKARLVFRFKDGSLYDDNVVFSQKGTFRILTEHLIEKGPSFKQASDTFLDTTTGEVKVQSTDEKGKQENRQDKVEMPADLVNGILSLVVKNIKPGVPQTLSMLVTTPKPRIVKLNVATDGEEPVYGGGVRVSAIRYRVKIDIGGVAGVAAKILGKQPADMLFWILKSDVPGFLKMRGQLYQDGPIWQMELSTPTWPKSSD